MNDYEQRQDDRRERYAARAAQKRREAAAAEAAFRVTADAIPPGQPILVGHHSERRHRGDLRRMDRSMSKAVEASAQAAALERKAAEYGTHSISSDDPEAVAKLERRLAKLENQRAEFKELNKQARRSGGEPLPAYKLSNLGANIRRIRGRIAQLSKASEVEYGSDIEGEGFRIVFAKEVNRVRFFFDTRPGTDARSLMKREGFRWSPSVGAWQRHLNNGGIYAAKCAARTLFGWTPTEG